MSYSEKAVIANWLKKTSRKGPFHLLRTEPITYTRSGYTTAGCKWIITDVSGTKYFVIWQEKEKTKLGYFHDGMSTRFGMHTLGVLSGKLVNGLWQARKGTVTMKDLDAMLRVANGLSPYKDTQNVLFDLETLENLEV